MEFKVRFDVSQMVITINNNSIVQLPVSHFEYSSARKQARYTLTVSKGIGFGDKDLTIEKDEDECFESINELAEYYRNKLKNRQAWDLESTEAGQKLQA